MKKRIALTVFALLLLARGALAATLSDSIAVEILNFDRWDYTADATWSISPEDAAGYSELDIATAAGDKIVDIITYQYGFGAEFSVGPEVPPDENGLHHVSVNLL